MTQPSPRTDAADADGPTDDSVVVIGPDGKPIGTVPVSLVSSGTEAGGDSDAAQDADCDDPSRMVDSPAKVMRIGSMIKQLLEEVRHAPLDVASRLRLKDIHANSVRELADGLAPELRDELARLALPFVDDEVPSEAELRIAQAQLVGWLEGLFHGIQATVVAQQMAARAQLEQMRSGGRALPPGMAIVPGGGDQPEQSGGHGQYL